VAVDFGPYGCILHTNIDDLATTYNVSGVTQFVLNRQCLPRSPQSTTTATIAEAQNFTETSGMFNIQNLVILFAGL